MSNRYIDLTTLPKIHTKQGDIIDWRSCSGQIINFQYDDLEGILEIIEILPNGKLSVRYNDKTFVVLKESIRKCRLEKIIGLINCDFIYNIGDVIKDDVRHLKIISRENCKKGNDKWNRRYYQLECLKCGFNGTGYYDRDKTYRSDGFWLNEYRLNKGINCPCCTSTIVSPKINSIFITNKSLFDLLENKEDGYKYTEHSSVKVNFKCPTCGEIKKCHISDVNDQGFSCQNCGDGMSIGEKYVYCMLKQLDVDFICQFRPNWANGKRYDFLIDGDKKIIIEINGIQHYKENTFHWNVTSESQKENDDNKRKMAFKNGIENYIVIDYISYDFENLWNNILKSSFSNLFDLSVVNTKECMEFASTSFLKISCELWNNKEESETITDIAKRMKIERHTVSRYLNIGTEIGLCNYDSKIEKAKTTRMNNLKRRKKVEIFLKGESLGIYKSIIDLINEYKCKHNIEFKYGGIVSVCNNLQHTHRGYTFKYIENET